MATPWPVVIDSCILFQACLRDTLLRAAAADLFRPHWSQKILDDTTNNLVAKGKVTSEQASALEATIKSAFPEAIVAVPEAQVAAMQNHEGDRHVAATAVVAGAAVIVTSNLRHFLPKDLEPYGIEAQDPDTFLVHLFDLAPLRMAQIVDEQAQALRRPIKTRDQILTYLSGPAPEFVKQLQAHFAALKPPAVSRHSRTP